MEYTGQRPNPALPSGQRPMRPPVRRRRRKIHPRLFVIAAVLLGLLIWLIVALATRADKQYVITLGRIEDTMDVQALIVREETIYPVDSYGQLVYTAKEGAQVDAGDPVMEVYAAGYIEKTVEDLELVRQQIAEYQQQLRSDIVDEELQVFNDSIAEVTEKIRAFASGQSQEVLLDLEYDLEELLNARREYLKNSTSGTNDPTLISLYEEETRYINRNAAWMTPYLAEGTGRISFYFDGLEPYLSQDSLQELSCEAVRSFLKGSVPEGYTTPRGQQYLYRLVNPNRWYAAFVVKEKDWNFEVGDTCEITFDGYEDLPYLANVYKLTGEEDQVLVILSMQEDIESLISQRVGSASVGTAVEGMVVPKSAVKTRDGVQGVFTTSGEFVPVRVLGKSGKQMLVMPAQENALTAGMVIRGR